MKKEEGMTLLEFFKVLFSRKLVILISIVSSVIILTLLLHFVYNNQKTKYEANFSYESVDLVNNQYLDGTSFDYRMLLNKDIYENVKENNSKLSTLDIDLLAKSNSITITSEMKQIDGESKYKTIYTLSVSKKYFATYDQAKNFITDLINYPINKNVDISKTLNYYSYIDMYKNANSYESKVNYLLKQYEYLVTNYNDLIEKYSNIYVDGILLSSYMNDLIGYFDEHDLSYLTNEISSGGYVLKYDNALAELNVQKNALEVKKSRNEGKINTLQNQIQILIDKVGASNISSIDLDSYNTEIAKLSTDNVDIQNEINLINSKISNYNSTDPSYLDKLASFENVLDLYGKKLNEYTKTYAAVQNDLAENCYVTYEYSNVISTAGGINIVVGVIASIIVGLFIGCGINLFLGKDKFFKDDNSDLNDEKATV